VHPIKITQAKRDRYVECYSKPCAMSNGFAYYRAVLLSAEQNQVLAENMLEMPVLALGGQGAMGNGLVMMMQKLAGDVCGGEIEDCGHYVMEEQPQEVARMLLDFFQKEECK